MDSKELKRLKVGTVLEEVSLKDYTTYKLSGKAKLVVFPDNLESLKRLLSSLKEHHERYKIIGGGSNLIFKEEYYDGVLIHLKHFDQLEIIDNQIKVGAGYSFMKLAIKASKLGLSGLEFASGIPGTVGGAIFNNAGAYKSDMGYVLLEATVLTPSLEVKKMKNREMQFHYRDSFFKHHPDYVILEAKMLLNKGNKEEILEIIEDRKERRLASQPLEYPSAGSVFRNPDQIPAGKLIEDLGYKGVSIGGAVVSEKHANFIINQKNATGKDIVQLIERIQNDVLEKYNIQLILEQEIVE